MALPPAALPLAGRVAIITGSSRGIGRAVAKHLASLGANVVVNYVSNSTQAELLVSELNMSASHPPRAISVQADVSDPSGAKTLFDRAEEAFGSPVHMFVNCAGISDSKNTIASTPLETLDAMFNVNARGAFLCCREAANRVVRGGGGRIIMVSTSLVGAYFPNYGAYTASKAAVEATVKILSKELKGTMITANCVSPGAIATDLLYAGASEEQIRSMMGMSPMGRIGETSDVAPVVGFLCTDAAEWVNGQVIRVNGGFV